MNTITIGFCKDCVWRKENRRCSNSHIDEDYGIKSEEDNMLVYSYDEGGSFEAGDNFGCVHFKEQS